MSQEIEYKVVHVGTCEGMAATERLLRDLGRQKWTLRAVEVDNNVRTLFLSRGKKRDR